MPGVFSSGIQSRRSSGDDPISEVQIEEFPSESEIKRSCQWVHRHHPPPSRPSLGVMMKWCVAAPSGSEKLDDGEPRRSKKTTTITHPICGRTVTTAAVLGF
ncbi:hypothetical protein EVAR_80038_1 [Eumeta japonica]|uniref:Uncharacterized protein n=1 Tax=Eumeta variegata TaxID=151549 RepID=A0A4C1WLQ0_EUMVA|nr:hypothetical protein EVAR_80038_1 [Eumeta japonica]